MVGNINRPAVRKKEVGQMTCLEFQGLMIRYINGELSYKEKEPFMEHVAGCENCKEELEIYYIILTSMKQMDEDKQLSDDFHEDFLARLKRTRLELAARKRSKVGRRIAFPALVGAIVLLTGLELSGEEEPELNSRFEMKFHFYRNERHRMFTPNITEQKFLEMLEKIE
ncbi:MAG: zf-HC2 domain-containing protein [Lachnospiraceae bacterium]|jgi:hypothetical protein|nr:zf-HC2 domain-containing protein [Lachnospiraceae bacterium]